MPSFTMTHKAQEIADYVKRQFGDESGVQVTDADIIRWINTSAREIAKQKEPLKSISTANLVVNQAQYTWPDNILQVQALKVNNRILKHMSFQEAEQYIFEQDPDGTSSGQPTVWYEYGGQFFLYPKPDKSATSGIQIFFIPAPTMIDSLADTLTVPDVYFNAVQEHVLAQAYELDENFDAAQVKLASFAQQMGENESDGSVERDFYPTITVLQEDM
jgi:hypothetical protein